MARIAYASVSFTARRTMRTREIDLATVDGARYYAAHHFDSATPDSLAAVLAAIEADPRPHTLPQSTDDLARNIRYRLALMARHAPAAT